MTEFIDLMRKQIELEKCENYKTIQLEAMGKAMKESLNKRIQFQCLHEMQNILYSFVSSQADMNQVQMHLMQQGYMQRQQIQIQQQPTQEEDEGFTGGYQNLLFADFYLSLR